MLPVAAIVSAIICLNYIGPWCVVMSDYCRWLPLSGVGPGLHSHFHSRLQFLQFAASMLVMVLLLILFHLLQVLGDILLVDTSRLKLA